MNTWIKNGKDWCRIISEIMGFLHTIPCHILCRGYLADYEWKRKKKNSLFFFYYLISLFHLNLVRFFLILPGYFGSYIRVCISWSLCPIHRSCAYPSNPSNWLRWAHFPSAITLLLFCQMPKVYISVSTAPLIVRLNVVQIASRWFFLTVALKAVFRFSKGRLSYRRHGEVWQ